MTDWDHGIVIQYDGTNYFIVNDGKRVAQAWAGGAVGRTTARLRALPYRRYRQAPL